MIGKKTKRYQQKKRRAKARLFLLGGINAPKYTPPLDRLLHR